MRKSASRIKVPMETFTDAAAEIHSPTAKNEEEEQQDDDDDQQEETINLKHGADIL